MLLADYQEQARCFKIIRDYFTERSFMEVQTPILHQEVDTDPMVAVKSVDIQGRRYFLQPSPEYQMKALLAAGSGSIFQIAHAVRNDPDSPWHQPEFFMLEWYEVGCDLSAGIATLQALLSAISSRPVEMVFFEYDELFQQVVGRSSLDITHQQLLEAAQPWLPPTPIQELSSAELMDLIFLQLIEPVLKPYPFAIVRHYPHGTALAKSCAHEPRFAARFELFIHGIEVANCYEEITDVDDLEAQLQQHRTTVDINGFRPYPHRFVQVHRTGLPACTGAALGVDRMLKCLRGDLRVDSAS